MRRHKAVARIFLFLTIANFTFAGLAQTPTMNETRFDLVTGGAEGVAEAAPEMGHMTRSEEEEEEPSEMLGRTSRAGHLQSRFDLIPAQSFNTGSLSTDPEDPEGKKFFNKELNRKLKEYLVLGSIAGIFTGVANGIQKQIAGTLSPYAYVYFFFFFYFLPPPPHPPANIFEWRGFNKTYSDYWHNSQVQRWVAP